MAVVEEVEVVKSGVLCTIAEDSLGVMLAWIVADDGQVESVESPKHRPILTVFTIILCKYEYALTIHMVVMRVGTV